MESAVSYLKCLLSYIEDDKYTNLIQDIDNAALEYEEAITNSTDSDLVFAKYDNLYSLLNEHITNLERYFKNFDTDEFIKTKLFTDDTINEEVLQNFEKEIIKYYLYEKYLFDFYGTVSLYTKITKNELAKQGIDYDNLLPQIVQKIDVDELKPVKKEVTIYVYQNGKISEKFDSTLSRFSFKALMETSGFDWNAKGYDVNMELMSKFKLLSAENEEEYEDSADVVLIESRTEEEKLLEEIVSQIQSDEYKLSLSDFNFDDFELNLDILLDDKNNAYIQDFNYLFFILCVLVNYVRENTDDESSDDSLEIIENKIKRVKKDIKEKLSKLGIKNIKGVLSSENAPKIFEGAIKVLPELSEIFDKETGEKREIYYSVLGDVFADDFKILTKKDEKDYKNIDVEISSLAKKAFKQAVTVSEKQIKSTDAKKVEVVPAERVKNSVSSTQIENESNEKKIDAKLNYKNNSSTDSSSNSNKKDKDDDKLSAGEIVGIVVTVVAISSGIAAAVWYHTRPHTATNSIENNVSIDNSRNSDSSFMVNRNSDSSNMVENRRDSNDNYNNRSDQNSNFESDNLNNSESRNPGSRKDETIQSNSDDNRSKNDSSSGKQQSRYVDPDELVINLGEDYLELFGITVNSTLGEEDENYIQKVKAEKGLNKYTLSEETRNRCISFFCGKEDDKNVFSEKTSKKVKENLVRIIYTYKYHSGNSYAVDLADSYAKLVFGFNDGDIDAMKKFAGFPMVEIDMKYIDACDKSIVNFVFFGDPFEDIPQYKGYYKIKLREFNHGRKKNSLLQVNGNKIFVFPDNENIEIILNKEFEGVIKSVGEGTDILPVFSYPDKSLRIGYSPIFFDDEEERKKAKDDVKYMVKKIYYFLNMLKRLNIVRDQPELRGIAKMLLPHPAAHNLLEKSYDYFTLLKNADYVNKINNNYFSYFKMLDIFQSKLFGMKNYQLPIVYYPSISYHTEKICFPCSFQSPAVNISFYSRLEVFMEPLVYAMEWRNKKRWGKLNDIRDSSEMRIEDDINRIYTTNVGEYNDRIYGKYWKSPNWDNVLYGNGGLGGELGDGFVKTANLIDINKTGDLSASQINSVKTSKLNETDIDQRMDDYYAQHPKAKQYYYNGELYSGGSDSWQYDIHSYDSLLPRMKKIRIELGSDPGVPSKDYPIGKVSENNVEAYIDLEMVDTYNNFENDYSNVIRNEIEKKYKRRIQVVENLKEKFKFKDIEDSQKINEIWKKIGSISKKIFEKEKAEIIQRLKEEEDGRRRKEIEQRCNDALQKYFS